MGIPGQECCSGLPFPSPEDLSDHGLNLCFLHWQVDSVLLSHQRPYNIMISIDLPNYLIWAGFLFPCANKLFCQKNSFLKRRGKHVHISEVEETQINLTHF